MPVLTQNVGISRIGRINRGSDLWVLDDSKSQATVCLVVHVLEVAHENECYRDHKERGELEPAT